MQTNTVIIVQKTSKGDVSGNTAYTPPGSTCITSTGGKIPLDRRSKTPIWPIQEYLIAYLALITIYTILPFNYKLLWDCHKVLYACPYSFLLPCMYTTPTVLLLPPYSPPSVSLIPFYLPASNIALNLVLGYTKP